MVRCLTGTLLALATFASQAHMQAAFEDRFAAREQARLVNWAQRVLGGVESLTAPLPFDVRVDFHRASSAREPVPWAHTRRGTRQGVSFHVNPAFDDTEFQADWTAPHEFSHLLIPYLGRRHAWFAEGFASYMQYQVMQHMGVLDAQEVVALYRQHMARAERRFDLDHLRFVDAAPRLRAAGRYPTMYWGGAVLFLRWDARLRAEHDTTLADVLAGYLACCRMTSRGVDGLIAALDEESGSDIFSDEFSRYSSARGFPQWQTAAAVLATHGPHAS